MVACLGFVGRLVTHLYRRAKQPHHEFSLNASVCQKKNSLHSLLLPSLSSLLLLKSLKLLSVSANMSEPIKNKRLDLQNAP